jgi:hypothetical protein
MYRGQVDESETHAVRAQIEAIRANFGTAGASGRGTTIDDMNQVFTAGQIEALSAELSANLNVALRLIVQSNDMRYKNAEPTA